ncbi:MBL fold metallo-hydrolase [Pelovirga terrestris]|uniref:MBL fold metallo-hydrolase n=1 Tax=Pelovirga terrestris TaxID=2771352 RepID=A0A8J6QT34_9BACT|nr:MBL fold metallo-hydrolase [Pelovirga terrestris]MBD1401455.1 MBL fold metallo-hydrolase [Pelovirga terrestris]
MSIKLTILCENSVEKASPYGLLGEYGFSCLVETTNGNYLFDTGGGLTIINNAERLGIDLRRLDGIILSHGHFDHTGGLKLVLEKTGPLAVYAHPDLFSRRFSSHGGPLRKIGIAWDQEELEHLGAHFQLSQDPVEIAENLLLSGCIPRTNPHETGDPKLVIEVAEGKLDSDPLEDDLSLFVRTDKGLVLLLGCAHAGLINIIDHAIAVTGEKRIHAVVGGTHLMFSGEAQLKATMDRLQSEKVTHIGASHCTGRRGALALAARFGDRFFSASVGATLQI